MNEHLPIYLLAGKWLQLLAQHKVAGYSKLTHRLVSFLIFGSFRTNSKLLFKHTVTGTSEAIPIVVYTLCVCLNCKFMMYIKYQSYWVSLLCHNIPLRFAFAFWRFETPHPPLVLSWYIYSSGKLYSLENRVVGLNLIKGSSLLFEKRFVLGLILMMLLFALALLTANLIDAHTPAKGYNHCISRQSIKFLRVVPPSAIKGAGTWSKLI